MKKPSEEILRTAAVCRDIGVTHKGLRPATQDRIILGRSPL
jgi:hypothetical protein